MIFRDLTPDRINRISNSSTVSPFVNYTGAPMDWRAAFPSRQTGIVVLTNGEDACAAFAMTGERTWQVHTLFEETCRGRRAITVGREMIEWMRRYADIIWGATPLANAKARWFNRQLGAKAVRRDHYPVEGDVEIFELRL